MKIGIHSVSSQSGRAFLVDMVEQGHSVYGYARPSENGTCFVEAIHHQQGIYLERPENEQHEMSHLVALSPTDVGHDLQALIADADVIILAHPSHFTQSSIKQLADAGIKNKRIPIILSPSRTFAVPYLWSILGEDYPFVCFSTNPYSCKAPSAGSVYIKRRKRSWLVSLEGAFTKEQIANIQSLFPQALLNTLPATTSIGNIGAIFHPAAYLLNYDAIKDAESKGEGYSFYMEGIFGNKKVTAHLEAIDQIRLTIAKILGLNVFGLKDQPNDERFQEIMNHLRDKEEEIDDIDQLRQVRHDYLREINDSILSAQHWLAYTYDVKRDPKETLGETIGRTKTYQQRSVPQSRYVEEDVPTGLVPLAAIGERLGLDVTPIKDILALYFRYYRRIETDDWRDLVDFPTDYIIRYLSGDCFKIVEPDRELEVVS